ncbi:MAG: hypothetical protein WDM77_09260 [Steroidobacteraceae bacterium]
MIKIAVLDDWQGIARDCADWAALDARAQIRFFSEAFIDEEDAASQLADFDIVLTMRERTPLPASLVKQLPRLRMLGITGAKKRLAGSGGLHGARGNRMQHHGISR